MYELVGISKGVSGKGNPYTVIHVISNFDDYMIGRGSLGRKAENIYIASDLNFPLGSKLDLVYGVGFGGKAVVKSVNLIK